MITMTITIGEDTQKKLKALSFVRNMTLDEITAFALEHGVKDLVYRRNRNQKKYQQKKMQEMQTEMIVAKIKEIDPDFDINSL